MIVKSLCLENSANKDLIFKTYIFNRLSYKNRRMDKNFGTLFVWDLYLDWKHMAFRAKKKMDPIITITTKDSTTCNCNFIYVDVGCNGRISDGGVYENSSSKPSSRRKY